MSATSALNVNVACLACDGTRPCAECRAAGKAVAAAGHRVHHSSRYAALRAAADGTYGFTACIVPVNDGERSITDALAALLPDARVAIAIDDADILSASLPAQFVSFPRADFRAGKLPQAWLDGLTRGNVATRPSHPSSAAARASHAPLARASRTSVPAAGASSATSGRSDATRRLRAMLAPRSSHMDLATLLADELAWFRASGVGFAVLRVSFKGARPEPAAAAVSEFVRSGDSVTLRGDDCIALLTGADAAHARRIATRVVGLACKRLGVARSAARLGVAACPSDGETADVLLARLNE